MTQTSGRPVDTSPAPRTMSFRSFLLSPFDPATWRALLALLLGPFTTLAAFVVLITVVSIGGSLWIVLLVGIPIVGFGIESSRYFARVERWRMEFADQRPLAPHRYRPLRYKPHKPYGEWLRSYGEAQFLDLSRWRDVVYTVIAFPLALLEFVFMLVPWAVVLGFLLATITLVTMDAEEAATVVILGLEGAERPPSAIAPIITGLMALALLPVAALATRGIAALHRIIVEALLCVDPQEALRQEAERLRVSRSAAVENEASELRRIERDLHDGAQQRLVMLAMDLGRAEEKIDSDPAEAKQLVADAREQSRLALAELRELVRGTAPSILIDRGLVAAVASIAGQSPVQTVLDGQRVGDRRFSPSVERAAYFAASEAMTNAAKHSEATRSDVIFWFDGSRLFVEVWDNGAGGASFEDGGGLAGLRDRLATVDGSIQLVSPPGGPTLVRVILPLEYAESDPGPTQRETQA